MAPASIDMGRSASSSFAKPFIKSQLSVKPKRAPAGTDLTGQVAIITGASSGLGLHSARHLLSLNLSHLILAVRSESKGRGVAEKFQKEFPKAKVDVWILEMNSYPSIQAFVQKVDSELSRVDIVILNAGISEVHFGVEPTTGHERIVQVNYLSTFLLAILLLPVLKRRAPPGQVSRLTIVSSGTALWAQLPNADKRPFLGSFSDQKVMKWDPMRQYMASKMLGHLFFSRLIEYLDPNAVIVNLVDPGLCKSDLSRNNTGVTAAITSILHGLLARTPEDGAWTYVDAAVVKGKESHGCFCMDWEIRPFTKLVYQPEGKAVIDALWNETLAEFEFAGVQQILEDSKAGQTK